MKRSLKARIPIVPAFRSEAARYPQSGPPPFLVRTPRYVTHTRLRRATPLLGHRIVVAALECHPIGLQILGAWQILGPGSTRNQRRRLPNDVELAVRTHLADEDRLGDVVVGQHFGRAAREVGSLD